MVCLYLSSNQFLSKPGVDSAAPRGYPTEAAGGEDKAPKQAIDVFEAAIREIGLAANATGANNERPRDFNQLIHLVPFTHFLHARLCCTGLPERAADRVAFALLVKLLRAVQGLTASPESISLTCLIPSRSVR